LIGLDWDWLWAFSVHLYYTAAEINLFDQNI